MILPILSEEHRKAHYENLNSLKAIDDRVYEQAVKDMLKWFVVELSKIDKDTGELKSLDVKFQFFLKDCKDKLAELEEK